MKAKQKIDKILELVIKKIEEEVTALIGADLTLSNFETALISKEAFFDTPSGKQVVAKLDIVGDVEGVGCLLVRLKDAIRLGGTLIMLPLNELEQTIANEDYNDETKDSFGEIANIIAGSYTKVFEENYPKSCRFVRKEQGVLAAAKVEIDSDQPVPNQMFYQVSSLMKLDDSEMGQMVVLLPAAAFGVEEKAEEKMEPKQQEEKEPQEKSIEQPKTDIQEGLEEGEKTIPQQEKTTVAVDVNKHKKRVDALLNECRGTMEEEVSALLGVSVKLGKIDNHLVSKEGFFLDEVEGKQVLAHMKVSGDREDKSYLSVDLKDAVRIGGILIMLPPAELDAAIAEDDFSEDAQDAFGEISNIIAGVYTGYFEEGYSESLRFVRTEMEQVTPLTVEAESDQPIPDQKYYVSSFSLTIEEKSYGKIHMLFPLSLLKLEALELIETAEEQKSSSVSSSEQEGNKPSRESVGEEISRGEKGADILLVSDDNQETEKISTVLKQLGYSFKILSFKKNINNYISQNLKAVFLVMHEVNEQAFGVVIKAKPSCSVPLIAAGPAWTRTKVIKAVKYGVDDILLTPASDQDIKEKVDNNLVQLAA